MKVRRPTLEDVAKLAGVSLGSASRTLVDPGQVKPATRDAVQRAVAQLGYVSNGAARALASRKTFTIGAVFPTMYNQAFVESLHTLQQTLWAAGYQVVLAIHEYAPDREYQVVRALVERGIDGLVIVGTTHGEEVFDLIRQRRMPLVMTWQVATPYYGSCVGFSNWRPLYEMTRQVLAHGHRDVAVVCGARAHNDRAQQRVAGSVDALREAGMTLTDDRVIEVPFSIEGGRAAVRAICGWATRPTALICHTDLQALGAIDECRARGIRVPQDLSITGMDDIELAAMATPPLTTIHVPSHEIGVLAARKIVSMIGGQDCGEDIELPCDLVLRDSLGPVPVERGTGLGSPSGRPSG